MHTNKIWHQYYSICVRCHFSGTTCYSNNLACHPAAGDMRSALKIKIHNAINSAILVDSEDRGIFVGGRRRNRKKKRTKHGNCWLWKIKKSRCLLHERFTYAYTPVYIHVNICVRNYMRTCILSVKTEKKKNKRFQGGKESTDMKNNSSKGTQIRVYVHVLYDMVGKCNI